MSTSEDPENACGREICLSVVFTFTLLIWPQNQFLKYNTWASKMTPWVKVPSTELDSLSSTSGTYIVEEPIPKILLWPSHTSCVTQKKLIKMQQKFKPQQVLTSHN